MLVVPLVTVPVRVWAAAVDVAMVSEKIAAKNREWASLVKNDSLLRQIILLGLDGASGARKSVRGGAMLHGWLERLYATVFLIVQGALDGRVEASGREIGSNASVDWRRTVLLKPCV